MDKSELGVPAFAEAFKKSLEYWADLPSLSLTNLAKLYYTAEDIDERLQIDPLPTIKIPLAFSAHAKLVPKDPKEAVVTAREDALKLLQYKKAVRGWKFILRDPLMVSLEDMMGTFTESVQVDVDIAKFREIKPQITEAFLAKEPETLIPEKQCGRTGKRPASQQPQDQDTDAMYEIELTTSREILINNLVLARPEFGSENEIVFRFLFDNPNRTVTLDELQKRMGDQPIKKTLHKIVENLGFQGDLKDAFFSVAKDSILFRNPIRKEDMKKLGKDRLRIPRT